MYILLLARLLLVLGGINYLFMATVNVNIFHYITSPVILRGIFLLIGVSAALFLFNRDYYLPFLGLTVMPIATKKSLDNVKNIKLSGLPSKTTVIAWGAQEGDKIFDDPFKAYGDYTNTVIAQTNDAGEVTIELPCPAEYNVNKFGLLKQKLDRHIHYRYELPNYKGLYSPVFTKYLNDKCE